MALLVLAAAVVWLMPAPRAATPGFAFLTVAGQAGTSGATDGTGGAALFFRPGGIVADESGNVLVADTENHVIRRIAPNGVVTTLAGQAGVPGSTNGTGAAATFNRPRGIDVDKYGNLYVADQQNHLIRRVTPAGVVTTYAGLAGLAGWVDGLAQDARFTSPADVAVDDDGWVYVADWGNALVRAIEPQTESLPPVVSTVAGQFGVTGSTDGTTANARFNLPIGIAVDRARTLYVADSNNFTIRKIAGGQVTTLAGSAGFGGSVDGTGSAARFSAAHGVTVDSAGNVYVADGGNRTIRRITQAGVVTTVGGTAGVNGSADGTGPLAAFNLPQALDIDHAGTLHIADTYNHTIRQGTPDSRLGDGATFVTLAGLAKTEGTADGTGNAARFKYPRGIAADASGHAYVADTGNHVIRKVSPAGVVTTLAGLAGSSGVADGAGSAARFMFPGGVAVDPNGTIYVADTFNHTIRVVTAGGDVTTLAGTHLFPNGGSNDGTGSGAGFRFPEGIAVDGSGTVYVADTWNHTIRRIAPGGIVTTLAGAAGLPGTSDGSGASARFNFPRGIAVSATGTVYVADTENGRIRQVTQAGVVTTIAGGPGQTGSTDSLLLGPAFRAPSGIAVDPSGGLVVADRDNHLIRHVTPNGIVTLLGGLARWPGAANGTGSTARFDEPSSVAVDSAGRIYVADALNHTVRLGWPPVAPPPATPPGFTLSVLTLAGVAGMSGTTDGLTAAARFDQPRGMASAGSTIYIASGHAIRRMTMAGSVDTFAGVADVSGQVDGTGSAARFNGPAGLAVDATGNVYVADTGNHAIRKVTPAGVVTTLAGLAGSFGSADGMGSTARFKQPEGVAVDALGNVYVADTGNHTIRRISPAGAVTTLAGMAGFGGSTDGFGSAARFNDPAAIAVTLAGGIYVADRLNHTIRALTPAGAVTTLAGLPGWPGSADGTGAGARFNQPAALATDVFGNLYVADRLNHTIRHVTPAGVVTTVAGEPGQSGSADGLGAAARFNLPSGLVIGATGIVYVADTGNHVIRQASEPPGGHITYTTLAGTDGVFGHVDDTGSAARFYGPHDVGVDAQGNVYVADVFNAVIRKVSPGGVVTTLAGLPGQQGSADGNGSAARFHGPVGIAVSMAGTVYVTDHHAIRAISPAGDVSTLAGSQQEAGATDGIGSSARFSSPQGVAVGADGTVFVADYGNHTIRAISPSGAVSTIAGLAGASGSADGAGAAARFLRPSDLDVDGAGRLYVVDAGNNTIRTVSPAGVVTTLAGQPQPYLGGYADGPGGLAQFRPWGIALGPDGAAYVADSGNSSIRRVTPAGMVTSVGGAPGQGGSAADGAGSAARFCNPRGVAADAAGRLYIADLCGQTIRKGTPGLLQNGDFTNGLSGWQVYGAPLPGDISAAVSGGVLEFTRDIPGPGSTNQATVFQATGIAPSGGTGLVATFDLGNSSTVRKRISVLLVDHPSFDDLAVCTFWLAPQSPLATYTMRTHTTRPWSNAAIYFYAATPGIDGGAYQIDNVSLFADPFVPADQTDCIDPTAPAPGAVINGPQLLVNTGFTGDSTTGWEFFGQMVRQVVNGVFEFYRPAATPDPAGVIFQRTNTAMTAGTVMTSTFALGNSSSVRKRVTVLLHDLDFSDLSACTFWLAPGQPLSPYAMRSFATKPWANATVSIYAASVGDDTWMRLDDVTLRRTSFAPTNGTDCVEPGGSLPQADDVADVSNDVPESTGPVHPAVVTGPVPPAVDPTTAVSPALAGTVSPVLPADRPVTTGTDEESARWLPSPGWSLTPVRAIAGEVPAWLGEIVSSGGEALVRGVPVEVSPGSSRLLFESWRSGHGTDAVVEISFDRETWQELAKVPVGEVWTLIGVDLSPFDGQMVWLRLRLAPAGGSPDGDGLWLVRRIQIVGAIPNEKPAAAGPAAGQDASGLDPSLLRARDPVDAYDERTRHTNADFPERMSDDELKQQAIVMATFAWQAAMMDGRIPRLPGRAP